MSLTPKMGFCKACGKERMLKSGRCAACHSARFKGYGQPETGTKITSKPSKKPTRKPTGELEFFKTLWKDKSRPRVSFINGEPIHHFDVRVFAHVLPKGAYGRWRLKPENIVYLTPQQHDQQHSIAPSDLIKRDPRWQKFFDLQDEFRIQYNNA